MIPAIKAEYRKIFTVRSTYIILAIVAALLVLVAFYISGWHVSKADLHDPTTLSSDIIGTISILSIFLGLISVLLMTHEYRYNTIMQTLTLSNSRHKVMLAKILVLTGLAVVFTLVVGTLSPLLSIAGMHANHLTLVSQSIHYRNILWRCLFFGWGYAMIALILATIIRNQIGAFITLFIVPSTVEGLAALLLKRDSVYLPFTALNTVMGSGIGDTQYSNTITQFHAALVFLVYLVVGGFIGWMLFTRRDVN
jgi:ABC-2 type transport system permease protein